MHRCFGTVIGLAMLIAAVRVHPNGSVLPSDTLNDARGGQSWACAIPSTVGQGCYGCFWQTNCDIIINGNYFYYDIYYHCLKTQYDVLCYQTTMNTSPPQPAPVCTADNRGSSCGWTNVTYSTYPDCSVVLMDYTLLCGDPLQYGCRRNFDMSHADQPQPNTSCLNIPQGNF